MRLKNASNQRQNKRVRNQLFEDDVTWGLIGDALLQDSIGIRNDSYVY